MSINTADPILPSPIQKLNLEGFLAEDVNLFIKRDDLLETRMQGNKYRKLKYNLQHAVEQGYSSVLSFGGAFSNHLHALAYAKELFGLDVIAYIRGDHLDPANPTIRHLQQMGVEMHFMDRSSYRNKTHQNVLKKISADHPGALIIPEGGTNKPAVEGAEELAQEILDQMAAPPDYCFVPVGSGGTMAGIVKGFSQKHTQVIGIPAIKGAEALQDLESVILSLVGPDLRNWQFQTSPSFGRFASMSDQLFDFVVEFKERFGILLDPIYTCKMAQLCLQMIRKGLLPKGANILMVHTGGIQGWEGMKYRFGDRYAFDQIFG